MQAIYPNKIYLAGIDSHYQIFRQFFFCAEIYIIIIYDRIEESHLLKKSLMENLVFCAVILSRDITRNFKENIYEVSVYTH